MSLLSRFLHRGQILQKAHDRLVGFLLLALAMMTLAACVKSDFTVSENTENRMVITAENAAKSAFFMIGSLNADEGDMIAISSGIACSR